MLRGSSSAFVGNELVFIYVPHQVAGETTPARSHSASALMITWVWNTDYAAKMHEWKGGWGEATERDTDAGNKWAEKHLLADRKDLIEVIGRSFKKESGL